MDNWLPFAIIAPFIYSINNFIDKLVLEKYIKEYLAIPVFTAIVALVFGILFLIYSNFPIFSFTDNLLVLGSGVCLIFGLALYIKALSKEETSLVIIMMQMTPVITLIISYFFLNEVISSRQFLGFMLILSAAVGVSIKKEKGKLKISKELALILLADLLWGVGYILFDVVSVNNEFMALLAYESLGVALGGLLLYIFFPVVNQSFKKTIHKINKAGLGFIFTNEFLYLISRICAYYAVSLGPVALVSIVGSTQVFFGIILGIILTLFMPKVFKENLTKESLVKKGAYGLLAFFGIVLIG